MRVLIGPTAELPEGSQTIIEIEGKTVVVICYEGAYYALRNNCSHQNYPLLGGEVSQGRITCEKHGARFELATGKPKSLPAVKPVAVYQTVVEDGQLFVETL